MNAMDSIAYQNRYNLDWYAGTFVIALTRPQLVVPR